MNDDDQDLKVEEDEKDAVANVPDPIEEPVESGAPVEPVVEVEKKEDGLEVPSEASVEIPVQGTGDDKEITLPEADELEGDGAPDVKTDPSDTAPVEITEGTETDASAALDDEVTGEEEAED